MAEIGKRSTLIQTKGEKKTFFFTTSISLRLRGTLVKQSQNGNQLPRDVITLAYSTNGNTPKKEQEHHDQNFKTNNQCPLTHKESLLLIGYRDSVYKEIFSLIGCSDSVTEKFHALLANFLKCNCVARFQPPNNSPR